MKINSNTVVFITGGASGLGFEAAQHFISLGAKVAIADLNITKSPDPKRQDWTPIQDWLKSIPDRIMAQVVDVTSDSQIKQAIYSVFENWGSIHVVIPCAGVNWPVLTIPRKGFLDVNKYKKVIDINLMGGTYVAKYGSVIMAKNKPDENGERGVIVFISSIAGSEGQRG